MTPAQRKLIYSTAASIVPVLVALGFLTDDLGKAILGLVASFISVVSLLLAKANVPK